MEVLWEFSAHLGWSSVILSFIMQRVSAGTLGCTGEGLQSLHVCAVRWNNSGFLLCCTVQMDKKAVPHIQCWTDSLTLPALNQTNYPTEVIVWITAEPGEEPCYSLDVHTFCLNVPQLAWRSAFLGTEVKAITKEPLWGLSSDPDISVVTRNHRNTRD